MKCSKCRFWLFFKPFPDETFSCCSAYKETVKDIDFCTGVSPNIKKYGLDNKPCPIFKKGKSACSPLWQKPFAVPQLRIDGERFILRKVLY